MSELKFPTEVIDLPSKGLIYPPESPLSSGQVEMKYMTAREEDILTNQSYIQNGTVLDKMLKSLIVSKIDIKDLLIGDKNALLIAARVLGYGNDYTFNYGGEDVTVDLSSLDHKKIDETMFKPAKNEFDFTCPTTKTNLTFKLLTGEDENKIDAELKGLKKISKETSADLSTRLKYIITSVEGDYDKKKIREFVDNYLLAKDSRALREYIRQIQPDVDLNVTIEVNGSEEEVEIPINLNFFWPDARV